MHGAKRLTKCTNYQSTYISLPINKKPAFYIAGF